MKQLALHRLINGDNSRETKPWKNKIVLDSEAQANNDLASDNIISLNFDYALRFVCGDIIRRLTHYLNVTSFLSFLLQTNIYNNKIAL